MLKTIRAGLMRIMTSTRAYPVVSAATLLKVVSLGYQAGVRRRARQFSDGRKSCRHLTRPVISVGNLTLGGTGKTPMTLHLARTIRDRGFRPFSESPRSGGSACETPSGQLYRWQRRRR